MLIIQNDVGNKHSPTVICAAITSRMNKAKLPTHVELSARDCDMMKDSVILLEQLRTIDKQRLREKICHLDGDLLDQVNDALKVSLELGGFCGPCGEKKLLHNRSLALQCAGMEDPCTVT